MHRFYSLCCGLLWLKKKGRTSGGGGAFNSLEELVEEQTVTESTDKNLLHSLGNHC